MKSPAERVAVGTRWHQVDGLWGCRLAAGKAGSPVALLHGE
jgi:hypothetical protein